MKYFPVAIAAIATYLCSSFASTQVQNLIPNGTFESFSAGGVPVGWTRTGNSLSLDETTVVSPFTDLYPISHHSLKLTSCVFYGTFTPQSGSLNFSFDFRLGVHTGSSIPRAFMELQGGGATHNLFGINDQTFNISDRLSNDITASIIQDTWYHVSLTLDDSHQNYTVSLTKFHGETLTWIDRIPMNFVNPSRFYFDSSSSYPFYLDNLSLISVPEPRITHLLFFTLVFGSIGCFGLTRRCS